MIRIDDGLYDRDGFRLAIAFDVAKGSITAVVGPSGAGKSTLLNIIAGFDTLQCGKVIIADVDHTHSPPAARPTNLIFQDHNSFAHLTARDNVGLGLHPSLRLSPSQWAEVDAALAAVGLSTLAQRKPGEMSGGERQRIAIARVLVRKKPVLLLDEAFAALGPALRRDMLQLVKSLAEQHGLTVLMVTHQPEDAKAIADHVMFVNDGEARKPVSVAAFFKSRDSAIRAYLETDSPA